MECELELPSRDDSECRKQCQYVGNDGPGTEVAPTQGGGTKTTQEISIGTIQTSYDSISITLVNPGINMAADESYFQLWCETTAGKTVGKFEEFNNRYVIEKLQPNTHYFVNLVKCVPCERQVIAEYMVPTLFCSQPEKFNIEYSGRVDLSLSWKAPLLRGKGTEITAYCVEVREYITGELVDEHICKPNETKWVFRRNPAYSYNFICFAKSGRKRLHAAEAQIHKRG